MLSFGVLIAYWSPKQSEIKKSSLESLSKSRIQGVWDPAHSIRLPRHSIRLPPLYTRMYHIRKSATVIIPSGCLTSRIQEPDGRGGRFNFSGQTYQDPPIAFTRRISQQFCTVLIAFTQRISQPILHSAAVFSWSFPICATDIFRYFSLDIFRWIFIFRYFALDIWYLNPQTLLITHQL